MKIIKKNLKYFAGLSWKVKGSAQFEFVPPGQKYRKYVFIYLEGVYKVESNTKTEYGGS
jgi:hypothetical protein